MSLVAAPSLAPAFGVAPNKRIEIPRVKRAVILSDIQIPFEDPAAIGQALDVVRRVRPDLVVLAGDVVDCYAESDFSKDAIRAQQSIPETHTRVRTLMSLLSHVPRKIWLGGNHEDRWRRLLQSESRVAKSLIQYHQHIADGVKLNLNDPDGSFADLFGVADYGFTYYPWNHRLYLAEGNLIVTHGKYVSRHSSYSAKRTWEWLGKSCIVGHTHRLGSYLVTQDGRLMGAWENGCLCQLEPEYDDAPNWQQGFSVVRVSGPEFHVIPVPIVRRGRKAVAVYSGTLS